jgi:acylphosphatase
MSELCRRFLISGRVQGVWFRESARRQAEKLKLSGKAINLPDGRVEVLVFGGESEIEKMAAWLRRGPTMARVDQVTEETVEHTGLTGFVTG